jgi:hypothetical protein
MSHKSERHLGVPLPCMAVSLGRRWRRQQRWLACVGAPARVAKAHAIALELDEAVVVARLVVADAAAVGEDLHTRVLCRRRELLQARRRRRHRADPCREKWRSDHYTVLSPAVLLMGSYLSTAPPSPWQGRGALLCCRFSWS